MPARPAYSPPAAELLAHGSTLPVSVPPTLGVAPGAAWCGLAVRFGQAAVDTSVVGEVACLPPGLDPDEQTTRPLVEAHYRTAVMARIRQLLDRHTPAAYNWHATHATPVPAGTPPIRVVLRWPPRHHPPGQRCRVADSATLYTALAVLLPDARTVQTPRVETIHQRRNGGTGLRADYVPGELLRQARPPGWSGHDGAAGKGPLDRRPEQAAWHVAGVGWAPTTVAA